jgi:branched-chain amino acid transport system permease protein
VETLLQVAVEGLGLGLIYAVLALSLWLLWDVARVVNLAHGDLAVVGAYTAWWVQSRYDAEPLAAVLVVVPAAAVLGPALHRLIFAPLLTRPPIASVLATFALSLGLQAALRAATSAMPVTARDTTAGTWSIGPVELTAAHGVVALLGGLLAAACVAALRRTWTGKSLRAVAGNRSAAHLLGVDVPRMVRLTVVAAIAVALTAGVLLAQLQWVQPMTGTAVTVKVLAVAAVSGLRRVRTVIAAAIAVGCTEVAVTSLAPGAGSRVVLLLSAAVVVVGLLVRPLRAAQDHPPATAAPAPQPAEERW